jgi:hypothetical protein
MRYLQHSLAVAELCELLTPAASDERRGVAYLTGICHDLGEILFYSAFGAEHQQIRDYAAATGDDPVALETQVFGTTKKNLELQLFESLALPDTISRPILAFHTLPRGRDETAPHGTRILRLSDAHANGLLLASHGSSAVSAFTGAEAIAATGQVNPPKPDSARFRARILTLAGLLGRNASANASALRPLYSRKDAQIILVRPACLSTFDPIQEALESLATVTVVPALPHGLAGYSGMVVLAPHGALAGFTAADIETVLKSAAAPPPQTLWIVGNRSSRAGNSSSVRSVEWPVPLDLLVDFTASLPSPRRAHAHVHESSALQR